MHERRAASNNRRSVSRAAQPLRWTWVQRPRGCSAPNCSGGATSDSRDPVALSLKLPPLWPSAAAGREQTTPSNQALHRSATLRWFGSATKVVAIVGVSALAHAERRRLRLRRPAAWHRRGFAGCDAWWGVAGIACDNKAGRQHEVHQHIRACVGTQSWVAPMARGLTHQAAHRRCCAPG